MGDPSNRPGPTPQAVADACRDAMWRDDHASHALGMQVLAVGPGSATLRLTVRQDMLNGHAICHGGLVTTLADSAFAFACNGYNEVSVASGFDVNLLAASKLGDVLTATACETSKSGRTGVYDVNVHNQRGEHIAAFRGRSYTVKGQALVEGLPVGKLAVMALAT
jgi:acyl-CoA thioesterase